MELNGLITAYVNLDYCCFACRKIISSEVAAGINTQFYSIIHQKSQLVADLEPLRVAVSLTACAVSDAKSSAPATGLVTVPTSPFPRPDMKPLTPPSVFTPSTVDVMTLVNPPMIPGKDKSSREVQNYWLYNVQNLIHLMLSAYTVYYAFNLIHRLFQTQLH